jgi:alpha-glucoside transport system substrate-binding protein
VAELRQLSIASQDLDQVLDTFGRHRLLSFDRDPITRGPTVEISHEALLTQWKRLRDWVDQARHDVRNQRRLAQALGEWVSAGRGGDYLLRGGQLDQLAGWAAETSVPLSEPESEFLEASLAERSRADREEREREERTTEAERSARQRLRMLSVVGVAAVVVAVLAVFAFVQRQAARDAEATVEQSRRSLELASQANRSLEEDPELSLLLAIEAARTSADSGFVTPEAIDALHWALQANSVVYPADATTPVALRSGPGGVSGVFALPPNELADLAAGEAERGFTEQECATLFPGEVCPDTSVPLPAGLGIFGGDAVYGVAANVPGTLEGTTVSLLGSIVSDDALEVELAGFEAATGINVSYFPAPAGLEFERREADGDPLPDLAMWPQPGAVTERARDGSIVRLSSYLDRDSFVLQYGPYLTSLVTLGPDGEWPAESGEVYGIPIDVDLKGLVFYPRAAFERAGYAVPATWDELIALSYQMVDDGRTPWCIAFEAGIASGWPGTDWIESLVLRVADPVVYDEWAFHRIPFDDARISQVVDLLEEVILTPGFVRGGSGSISKLDSGVESVLPMLGEPECWLSHNQDGVFSLLPAVTELGTDVDFFVLPPVDPGKPTPSAGAGALMTAQMDRPEIRAFLEYVALPQWGELWANDPTSTFLSPNLQFDTSMYALDGTEADQALGRAMGTAVRDALAADAWRFDASDLMPREIGAATREGPGAFWRGMVDYVDGVRTLDQVLSDIEAAWVALEAEGG